MPVAHRRGEVMFFEQRTGSCFDFMIPGPAGPAAIRVERALRIHGSLAGIARDYAGTIDRMNAAVLPPGISRELWLWAPWGTMRYFRIEVDIITELDMLGNIRLPLVKGARAGRKRPRRRRSRKTAGNATMPPISVAEHQADDPVLQQPGAQLPATGTGREPAPIRYLKRRAAELKQKKEEELRSTATGRSAVVKPGTIPQGGDEDSPS